jgi:hypothetical protein
VNAEERRALRRLVDRERRRRTSRIERGWNRVGALAPVCWEAAGGDPELALLLALEERARRVAPSGEI